MKNFFPLLLALVMASRAEAATKTVAFEVTGWTCGSCAASTKIALKKLEGVEDVKTDLKNKEAVVIYDDTKVTPEGTIQAIQRVGYKAKGMAELRKAVEQGITALPAEDESTPWR